ncbi:MFS transporter [Aquabacterium sp.]|uniref:MFS transporter n=1 Tax=Aquabacterium sp. TaxID=1872578 RepID=UPI0025BDE18B|nr:MFS transporter [Aquabacterium sp.]
MSGAVPVPPSSPSPPPPPPPPPFNARLATGLLGILLAAMVSGLNNRVPGLAMPDIRGALGFGQDDASWLQSMYAAGELAAMPFATWFAITFSLRRFHMWMLSSMLVLALVMPWLPSLPLMILARGIQGLIAGTLIPLLMMSALRFLPPPIRLHGLALYAMTATFAPNVAVWLAAWCLDGLHDWRWAYWLVIPPGLLALALVGWGIPKMPLALPRMRQANWFGMGLGIPGLVLLALALDQGVRLDWLHSPVVRALLILGGTFTALFLVSEWRHSAPFMRLQMLSRCNLGLGFSIFFCLLITLSAGVALPVNTLVHLHGFRMYEVAPLGLSIGLPQLVLGPAVALLLYQRWVDARHLFVLGLLLIATACWMASQIDPSWMVQEFHLIQVLQALGQPLAVVSLLFLGTSVVQPMEGPSVAGIINTLRALGTVCSGALVGELMHVCGSFHASALADQGAQWMARAGALGAGYAPSWGQELAEQVTVLAAADVFRLFALLALLLIPGVLCLQHIPAPKIPPRPQPSVQPLSPAKG